MNSVMVDFAQDSGWASEVWEFGEQAVNRCASSDCLDAGDQRIGGMGWYRQ
jgi:hypothetical protein